MSSFFTSKRLRYCFVIGLTILFVLYNLPKYNSNKIKKKVPKPHFFHYKNKLTDLDNDRFKSCIYDNGDTVNYIKMKHLVDGIMKMNFPEYYWEKMRISTKSSNEIDAAKLHRDAISNNYESSTNMFYTVIIYLQDSEFGYIPDSNNKLEVEQEEKIINVSKNDIIMFDSTMLHRGVFKNRRKSKRTTIQIFNVIRRSKIDYCKLIQNSILSTNPFEKFLYSKTLCKFDKRTIFNPRSNGTNYLLLMPEGGSTRTKKDIDEQNLYYMNVDFPRIIKTIKSNLKKLYRFY